MRYLLPFVLGIALLGVGPTVPPVPADLSSIVAAAKPAVVFIVALGPSGTQSGSGFAVASTATDTTIVTANHVVEGESQVDVIFDSNERERYTARVIKRDHARDVAILSVPVGNRPTLKLAPPESIREGMSIALIGYPIHKILLQPIADKGPEAQMMTTFGISIIAQNLFLLAFSADTRAIERDYANVPLAVGPISVPQIYAIGFAISVAILLAVHLLLSRTGFGRDLRASADDPRAAAILGVNVRRVHALTFALGAAAAGIGGTLIGVAFAFTPSGGATYLLTDFAIIVLGGLGNVLGTLFGGVVIGVLQSLGGLTLGDGYRDLVSLVLFLAVLAIRPQGFLKGRA